RSVPYRKACQSAGRIVVDHRHVVYPGAGRPCAERAFDARHGLLITLDERLNAAVGQIRHPPGYAFTHRGIPCKPAETDALHASADDETACDAHGREYRLYVAVRSWLVVGGSWSSQRQRFIAPSCSRPYSPITRSRVTTTAGHSQSETHRRQLP